MESELKKRLFSNVIKSTKPERISYWLPSPGLSLGSVVSKGAAIAASIGLLMLVIGRLKILF